MPVLLPMLLLLCRLIQPRPLPPRPRPLVVALQSLMGCPLPHRTCPTKLTTLPQLLATWLVLPNPTAHRRVPMAPHQAPLTVPHQHPMAPTHQALLMVPHRQALMALPNTTIPDHQRAPTVPRQALTAHHLVPIRLAPMVPLLAAAMAAMAARPALLTC